ncbi:MAG: aconitate hydratase AcnA [Polyangiaceae bacterium]|nr:aconitate hydratase AcnA [Polyangiaceae bacterium]MCE7890045.1 aconitate hydratase AcnA [Sorangiineae bacterium PRO1]MCL4749447.1 aconitate hydratase AcnA [Myxococcales bacterium]
MSRSRDSFSTRTDLEISGKKLAYFSLPKLGQKTGKDVARLPFSLRILLENLLRHEDGKVVSEKDVEGLLAWDAKAEPDKEIAFHPARVVLQDFTGVPAVVDLAAMRDAIAELGGDPNKINPLFPSELVIDHSVQVDNYGSADALVRNTELEYGRNQERYALLRWAQKAFENFKVVPPSTGIVHQVNVEYLARVVFDSEGLAYPDTLVGTDSHTTMVNGMGVLGWGVGGIEAEAAMLGQPINLLVPQVIGFKLHGTLPEGATATDLVLTITRMLRDKGVVGKFVEFYGSGLDNLPLANRATIGNMSPEFGSTCGIFPIDDETLRYLRLTGRSEAQVKLVEAYAKAQGMFRTKDTPDPVYTDSLALDLGSVEPTLAGPRRPHDKVLMKDMKPAFQKVLGEMIAQGKAKKGGGVATPEEVAKRVKTSLGGSDFELAHGSVVIAAITSCTNTSNPYVMLGAGLLARNAVRRGLSVKPWVKTSLAPGSKVVTQYLKSAGVLSDLEALHFNVVGYGCTTCIGNSGPLPESISKGVKDGDLVAAAVLSGNRNFEGRIHADVRANYLASPPLVVAYALAGRVDIDFAAEPIGKDQGGKDVFLKDIWPSPKEVAEVVEKHVTSEAYSREYAEVFAGDERWRALPVPEGSRFDWDPKSTYVRKPSFFENLPKQPKPLTDIAAARVLAVLGDSITTDHISPAGNIAKDSAAAKYLTDNGVKPADFNQYGARRGNHEVMMRGTFANVRLRNALVPGVEGGVTRHLPTNQQMSIYDASMKYQADGVPLMILAGKEYGSGSSRDWAGKGTFMLGIKAVVAESYERIHRSNLIGMGVLPLQFLDGQSRESLGLSGEETFSISGVAKDLAPGKLLTLEAVAADGSMKSFQAKTRIDTVVELEYYRHGGILQYVLRQLLGS